jgi:hypothetical protein
VQPKKYILFAVGLNALLVHFGTMHIFPMIDPPDLEYFEMAPRSASVKVNAPTFSNGYSAATFAAPSSSNLIWSVTQTPSTQTSFSVSSFSVC